MVIYYSLPNLKSNQEVKLKILNSDGEIVNSFTSISDKNHIDYEGGPSKKNKLSSKKGINRFVWNLRHSMLKGIPKAYIEGNYGGRSLQSLNAPIDSALCIGGDSSAI